MKLTMIWILLGSALASTATVIAQTSAPPVDDKRPGLVAWRSHEIDPERAATETRWIGLRPAASPACPAVSGWTVKPLLDVKTEYPRSAELAMLRELSLDRFCVYTATTNPPQAFLPPAGLVAAKDRMAVAANAGEVELAVAPVLAEEFLRQSGANLSIPLGDRPRIRLTFVDSQPDGEGLPPRPVGSLHGYTLAHLAQELACPAPDRCAAALATRQALYYDHFDPHQPLQPVAATAPGSARSGSIGLVSDLAAAIVREVLQWRQAGQPEHLILNISLGWDGELFDTLDAHRLAKLEPSAQAVYDALRFAKRQGVLVIAAAGNRRGGSRPSRWPLLPAAWENRRPTWLGFAWGRKLVYAVGGVDWQGLPLPNSRTGGRPRRTAFGDHAVALAGGERTAIYTGSSVSAAVVSSIAAVVWHLRPELAPADVMRLIRRSGHRLEVDADYYLWKHIWPLSWLIPPPRMREITLCRAVTRACGPAGVRCPALGALPACAPWDPQPPALATRIAAVLPTVTAVHYEPAAPGSTLSLPCQPGTQLWTPGSTAPAAPCPAEQFSSLSDERWVMPQPEDEPCPSCSLYPPPPKIASLAPASAVAASGAPAASGRYALAVDIGSAWQALVPSARLVSAALDIECYRHGRMTRRLSYPISMERPIAAVWAVGGMNEPASLRGCTAQLNFAVEKDGEILSVQNPVVVDP